MVKSNIKNIGFKEALEILGIEDYAEKIWKAESHGELFHIYDYIFLAKNFLNNDRGITKEEFREFYIEVTEVFKNECNPYLHFCKIFYQIAELNLKSGNYEQTIRRNKI